MITIVVRLEMDADVERDDVEFWPSIIASSRDRAGHPTVSLVGRTKTAALAWDLIEALVGRPAPEPAYRITLHPANLTDEVNPEDMTE